MSPLPSVLLSVSTCPRSTLPDHTLFCPCPALPCTLPCGRLPFPNPMSCPALPCFTPALPCPVPCLHGLGLPFAFQLDLLHPTLPCSALPCPGSCLHGPNLPSCAAPHDLLCSTLPCLVPCFQGHVSPSYCADCHALSGLHTAWIHTATSAVCLHLGVYMLCVSVRAAIKGCPSA